MTTLDLNIAKVKGVLSLKVLKSTARIVYETKLKYYDVWEALQALKADKKVEHGVKGTWNYWRLPQ